MTAPGPMATGVKMPAAGLTRRAARCANRCSPSGCADGGGAAADPLEQLVEVFRRGDRDRAGTVDRAFGHAGQHAARAELGELGDAERRPASAGSASSAPGSRAARTAAPSTRRRGRAAWRRRSTRPGSRRRGCRPRRSRRAAGRGPAAMNGVWKAPRHRQRHDLLGAELLGVLAGGLDAVVRAGDHDLAGCVEVRDPHLGVGAIAGDLDLVVVEAEHRRHRARLGHAGVVHRVPHAR